MFKSAFTITFLFTQVFTECYSQMSFGNEPTLTSMDKAITYTIRVDNELPAPIDVYFFTAPAKFNKKNAEYVNSVATKVVQPNGTSQAKFTFTTKFYAATLNHNEFASGPVSTSSISLQPMSFGEYTDLDVDKNGDPFLKPPRSPTATENAVAGGAFVINTPEFMMTKMSNPNYHIGLGAITNGLETITSFTQAMPGMTYNVQPIVKFYVAIGSMQKDTNVKFVGSSATAAECDATEGNTNFRVTRKRNGTWEVAGSV